MKNIVIILFFVYYSTSLTAQNQFGSIYPIGENPNIGYKTSIVPSIEKILFEANPNLRMAFYNNIQKRLSNGRNGTTMYLSFKPQLRMYSENSRPVKMPSYQISILGFQGIYKLPKFNKKYDNLISFSIESGHYSNGQNNCAFNKDIEDGTRQCDSIYSLITEASNLSNLLNRSSGNFSTNYTEIIVNYRIFPKLDENYVPLSCIAISAGINIFHDKLLFLADYGGYSDNDIKIYGKYRYKFSVEGSNHINSGNWFSENFNLDRLNLRYNFEYISNPHSYVCRSRNEITLTSYFKNNLGIFISGIFGHDNYNYRFVDSGNQFFAGITFDIFPPIEIKLED